MSYPIELQKDSIEESAIISAFIQFMNIRFKDHDCYPYFKNKILPVIKQYSLEVLKIDELTAQNNINIIEQRRQETLKKLERERNPVFQSIEDAINFIKRLEEEKNSVTS